MPEFLNAYQTATSLVNQRFEDTKDLATDALSDLQDLLGRLVDFAEDLQPMNLAISIDPTSFATGSFDPLENRPVRPDLSVSFPSQPGNIVAPTIETSDLTLPDWSDLITPVISLNPGDNHYTSDLLTSLQAKLLHDVTYGGTGLAPEVESAIYSREDERARQALADAIDRAREAWAKTGMILPDGTLVALIQEQHVLYINRRLDMSRDIAIKQAELAQTNTHFAIEKGIALDNSLMNLYNLFQERTFQASKAYMDAQLLYYQSQIQKYRVMADIYKALVDTRIEQARAIVQIYVAEIEAYKARVEAEKSRIDAVARTYEVDLGAYRTNAEVFRTLVESDVKVFEARIQQAVANANLALKDAEIRLKNYEVYGSLKIEVIKAAAAAAAQLVAGAMSAVSASAAIKAGGETQFTEHAGTTTTHQHTYKEK